METEDAALWRAGGDRPHGDAPRLVYADWLEEHGRPERAEFVRVQCRLAALDADDPARSPLERRDRQLWLKHRATWRAGLPRLLAGFPFERGFVYPRNLHLNPGRFLALGDDLFAQTPLWDVSLALRRPEALTGLIAADRLRRLGGLELDGSGLA